MGMNVGGDGQYTSEINITPLVDVVLVLLIIFMMIVPVMMKGYDVDMPGETIAAERPDEDRPDQVVLRIDLDACPLTDPPSTAGLPTGCTVHLNDDAVAVGDLTERIGDTYAGRKREDRVLFLAANSRLNYEGVMRILDAAKAGTEDLRIGLVTE